ncbi:hypothetical protein K505DRAFT_366543 [Melanomma pulvis-pyrius CBS 109.77]|uniref:Uncharacterized protein n=1 Tax=Melanomma pulvis-pyrius CBS 109.77 TaxID=1314802 RepID=A0A6A6WWQ9_9PLEO|nr:hypothetical protein K505DRAFT_366543 [Melanomma pulvis-pyrius CBS 109.77]
MDDIARPSLPKKMYRMLRQAWVRSRMYNWPKDAFKVALLFTIMINAALAMRFGLGIWLMIMFEQFGDNSLECWDKSESKVTVLMPIAVKDMVGEAHTFSIYGKPHKVLDFLPSYVFFSLPLLSESITVGFPFVMLLVFAMFSVTQFRKPGSTRRAIITSLVTLATLACVHIADLELVASAWEVDDNLAVCRTPEAGRLFKQHERRLKVLSIRNWTTWAGMAFLALYFFTVVYAIYDIWKEQRDSLPQSIPLQNVDPNPHYEPPPTPPLRDAGHLLTPTLRDVGNLLSPTPPLPVIASSSHTANSRHGTSTNGIQGGRSTATSH